MHEPSSTVHLYLNSYYFVVVFKFDIKLTAKGVKTCNCMYSVLKIYITLYI